jgi:hypothetical protein
MAAMVRVAAVRPLPFSLANSVSFYLSFYHGGRPFVDIVGLSFSGTFARRSFGYNFTGGNNPCQAILTVRWS